MLDIKLIRENRDRVRQGALAKNQECDIDQILALDSDRRDLIKEVESLKGERNNASAEIAKKKKAGESTDDAIAAMKKVGEKISALDSQLREIDAQLFELRSWIPNLPHESVPVGDESANEVVREFGEKRTFEFTPQPHWDIGRQLDILDLPASARISGAGFHLLKGAGAKLQRALINYMIDLHTSDGFVELAVPHLVTRESLRGTGQLPKMEEDMYRTSEDDLYLIPTAEVPVTNMYQGQVLDEKQLPMSFVAHTPCYRREAGAAGKDTRGILRLHQFDKVELVQIVKPDESYEALEKLTTQAEKVVRGLKLPYRVSKLATGDLSFAAAMCYDIELWAPGVDSWLEVSSVSNFEDFQARRINMRYRDSNNKVLFPHTLNGSGTALPRLIIAIIENYQNEDGSITVPEILKPYFSGIDKIN